MSTSIRILCERAEDIALDALVPHKKNPNKHSQEQIDRLAALIRYHGFRHPIIVSKRSGFIVAGHGRLEAARQLRMAKVPVDYQDFESDEAEYAFLVADNSIALWAELDLAAINLEVPNLGPDFDIDMLGIKDFAIDVAEKGGEKEPPEEAGLYTSKIVPPIYEPKSLTPPPLSALVSFEKSRALKAKIDAADIPPEIADFLRAAAERHNVFDYEQIAEFYSHAPSNVKALMEESALVIIDFKKAIEGGFVALSKALAASYLDA